MSLRFYTVVIDSHDLEGCRRREATAVQGWEVTYEAADEVVIEAPYMADESRTVPLDERGPGLMVLADPEGNEFLARLEGSATGLKGFPVRQEKLLRGLSESRGRGSWSRCGRPLGARRGGRFS